MTLCIALKGEYGGCTVTVDHELSLNHFFYNSFGFSRINNDNEKQPFCNISHVVG